MSNLYDLSLSFLKNDELLAKEIYDAFKDRVKVFIFSEKQEQIAGTDGQIEFSKIFKDNSKYIVVLYRDGWGKSGWTLTEETAIKENGFKNAFQSILFVNLDNSNVPVWLPHTRMWYDYERYGLPGLLAAIENNLVQHDVKIKPETIDNFAKRYKEKIDHFNQTHELFHKQEGVALFKKEFEILKHEIFKKIELINTTKSFVEILTISKNERHFCFFIGVYKINFYLSLQFGNSLDFSGLNVIFEKGNKLDTQLGAGYYSEFLNEAYQFDLNVLKRNIWKTNSKHFTSIDLADYTIKKFIEQITAAFTTNDLA